MAVAEEAHFGRAAKRLHIAQPPLSRQIHALETELGFSLFDRKNRRVTITAAGEVFLAHARRVFEALDLAVREAKRANAGETGRIAVGYLASLAFSGITDLLRAFRARFPSVELALREMPPQEQIEALKEGRIDVGFVRAPIDDDSLAYERIKREELMAALPLAHPLAARKRVPLAALANEAFVFFPRSRGPAIFDQLMALCRAAGFVPRIVQEAPQLDVPSLVAAGFGVSIVPASMRNVAQSGCVLRPIVGAPSADLLLARRADDRSPALAEFLAFVRRVGIEPARAPRRASRAVSRRAETRRIVAK